MLNQEPSHQENHPAYQPDDDGFTYSDYRYLKHQFEQSHLHFTRYFFKKREGSKFLISPHHEVICKTLDEVLKGNIKRLIINIPPGYSKTELAVITFIPHGLAINRQSKFIHISYSDTLVQNNSAAVLDIVKSDEFRRLWPMTLRSDSKSKKDWMTDEGGAMLAVASGGTITGFRAGRLQEGFSGALIIDDPMKPDDAFSAVMRDRINMRFTNTFKSRLAHEDVPIVVIMQRVHEDDPTGFLLRGGTGEHWHHLLLPALIPEKAQKYPSEYTHGIPIDHGIPSGPIWPLKHTEEDIKLMEESDPYTHSSQYDQRPAPLGGGLFKSKWWKYYDVVPNIEFKVITADTAQKEKEANDFSVFQCWGFHEGNIYLLDQMRGKWEAPDLKVHFEAFWNAHFGTGSAAVRGELRSAHVEDKASGTGLIQDIANDTNLSIPIFAIQRHKDKVTRAMDNVPYIASGYVYLPKSAPFLAEYLSEFSKFTPMMTHKFDDQIDATLDAIDILLRDGVEWSGWAGD